MIKMTQEEFAKENTEELKTILFELCTIPSPPGHKESARAEYVREKLEKFGAKNILGDDADNVIMPYISDISAKYIIFTAHMDTVFHRDTDLEIQVDGDIARCPGIGDDTANMAQLLMLAKYVLSEKPTFKYNLLFVWDTGEEGLENLRGARELMKNYSDKCAEFIALDGVYTTITNSAIGSARYKIEITCDGGHSYRNFGLHGAIERIAELVSLLYAQKVSDGVTYNVGIIGGGSTVNTIAGSAYIIYEYRAPSKIKLEEMRLQLAAILADFEPKCRSVDCKLLGERPAGGEAEGEDVLLSRGMAAVRKVLGEDVKLHISAGSTDCNIPLSLGIPAICTGGYLGGAAHTTDEWINLASLETGLSVLLNLLASYKKL